MVLGEDKLAATAMMEGEVGKEAMHLHPCQAVQTLLAYAISS